MAKIRINSDECIGCGACVNACPVELFRLENDKALLVGDREKCVLCRACESSCPVAAIKVSED